MVRGPPIPGSGRATRVGTLRLFLFAGLTLAIIGAGFGFLHSRGQTGSGIPSYFTGTAGTQQLGLRLKGHAPRTPVVAARALPAFDFGSVLTALNVDNWTFGLQFLAALLPAILVEILVLPQVQEYLTEQGIRAPVEGRDYVAGSDQTIKVQRAFDFKAWETQRKNPDRYWSILGATLGNSSMLTRLQGPLFFLNMIAAGTLFYSRYLVPEGYPAFALPTLPFSVSSFALGLLVTFRVNTSNNRFVTARNKWGSILNISRDLSQQACLWAQRKEDALDFARWVPAFSLALMCHLRDPRSHDLKAELQAAAGPLESAEGDARGLSESEIQEIIDRPAGMNSPHFVLHRLRAKMNGLGVTHEQRLLMEHNITRLVDDLGACENIFATPIPLGYTKHTARFLLLWLMLLPLALESQLGFGVVFAQQLLAFGLLGVEDVGIQIEEPFAVLPLKRITTKIALEAQLVRRNTDDLNDRGGTWLAPASASKEAAAEMSGTVPSPIAMLLEQKLDPISTAMPSAEESSLEREPELASASSDARSTAASSKTEPKLETLAVPAQTQRFDMSIDDKVEDELPGLVDFKSWLAERKISKYIDIFEEQGYDDLLILAEADDDEIDALVKACGMRSGHARHFTRGVAELRRGRQREYQEWRENMSAPSHMDA